MIPNEMMARTRYQCCQPNVVTLPKSSNSERQKENLEASNIQLSDDDVRLLDAIVASS